MRVLVIAPPSAAALERELAGNLGRGGCFVPGATDLAINAACLLVLVHPVDGSRLELDARVVWRAPVGEAEAGVGVAIEGFSPAVRARIRAFVDQPEPAAPATAAPGGDETRDGAEADTGWVMVDEAPNDEDASLAAEARARTVPDQGPLHRLRGLSTNEQLRIAREGEVTERVLVERLYGKNVWPVLVANPRLTVPEVTRLARMGNMPRPQLEVIVANQSWLASAQVRRALLTNPRLTQEMIRKVLHAMPRHELRAIVQQTSYPAAVRQQAALLMGR